MERINTEVKILPATEDRFDVVQPQTEPQTLVQPDMDVDLDAELERLESALFEESEHAEHYDSLDQRLRGADDLNTWRFEDKTESCELDMIPLRNSKVLNEAIARLEAVATSQTDSAKSNIRGFHMIFGRSMLNTVMKDVVGSYESTTGIFVKAMNMGFGPMVFLTKFLNFLGWLSTPGGYLASANLRVDGQITRAMMAEDLPLEQHLTTLRQRVVPFGKYPAFFWAMEGIQAAKTHNNSHKIHYHVIVLLPSQINSKRANYITRGIVDYFGSEVTLRQLRSSNQLRYIFKEKTLGGVTIPTGREGKAEVVDILEDANKILSVIGDLSSLDCQFCADVVPIKMVDFLDSFGFDQNAASYYSKSKNSEFQKLFKDMNAFRAALEDLKAPSECYKRLQSAVNFNSKVLGRILYFEFGQVKAEIVIRLLNRLMDEFIAGNNLYRDIMDWIRQNLVDVKNGVCQTWRRVLCVGGPGGNGKTKLSRCIFSGIGEIWENHDFKKHNIDRGIHSAYSMLRFYDEAPVGKATGRDVYTNFIELEAPTSRLYKQNIESSACQFIFICNAQVQGLPTFADFRQIKGQQVAESLNANQEYEIFRTMALRRFGFTYLHDLDNFLRPYIRMFMDEFALVQPRVETVWNSQYGILNR